MTWTYSESRNSSATITFNAAQNTLNGLTMAQNRSAKIATFDRHDDDTTSVMSSDKGSNQNGD